MAQAPVLPRGFELPLEPRLPRIGSVDAVALEERAASLAKRSIKREAKVFALELAIRMMDLTTLEGQDTPGKIAALASKAIRPDPTDPSIPPVAAICVYPNLVPPAVARVKGTSVKVASVATAFPSGQSPLEAKLEEVRWVVEQGADEVDMVIDRGAFLAGRYAKVYDEIVQVKEAVGEKHLKVILETGELGTYDNVRRSPLCGSTRPLLNRARSSSSRSATASSSAASSSSRAPASTTRRSIPRARSRSRRSRR